VKRGSKRISSEGDVRDRLSLIPPWAAWCWLSPGASETQENPTFYDGLGELGWVRRQIASVIDVTDLVNPYPEKLESESVSTSDILRPLRKRPMHPPRIPSTVPKIVFLASAKRSDPIEQVAAAFEEQYPEASLQVVLGEWWVGHRRTWPIAKKWTAVYWYQCHDVVLPKLLSECEDWLSRTTTKMALVVSKDSSIRRMWLEILPQQGFQAVAVSQRMELPEGSIDVVFYDQAESDSASDIAVLRKTFPEAKIVVCFGFPDWNQAKRCIEAGADVILGKPFQMEGVRAILAEWSPKQ
jgi:CheY-like chemotaxis protein